VDLRIIKERGVIAQQEMTGEREAGMIRWQKKI